MTTQILYVEDDAIIASGLVYALETEGYAVTHIGDVHAALAALGSGERFDLALLDVSLPDGNGFEICEAIKGGDTAARDIPVIFLTAADDEGNTVRGLETGADDYIAKPFRVREVLARIKVALRHKDVSVASASVPSSASAESVGSAAHELFFIGDIRIDPVAARVFKTSSGNTDEIFLSALEYRLLLLFANNKGIVLTRARILELLWDEAGNFVNDNTLTVYIKRLREKLGDDPQEPRLIETVRGLGYRGAAGD